jgi:hypothetical protein
MSMKNSIYITTQDKRRLEDLLAQAADCRKICVHARPHVLIEPGLATLRAKDDMKDDFT